MAQHNIRHQVSIPCHPTVSDTYVCMQWMDVLLVDETPSEFDKLKQVRRQNVKPVSLQLGSHTMMVQQKLGQGAFASVYQVIAWANILQCPSLVLSITMQIHCQKH